jgi:hypothetical protein
MLSHYAQADDDIARVLFSGSRVKDGIETINSLLEARGLRRTKARLKPAFDQLGEINTTRNNIIHWGAKMDQSAAGGPSFIVSNEHLVRRGRSEKRYAIGLATFHEMLADLFKVGVHLSLEMYRDSLTKPIYRKVVRRILKCAWLYKAPQRAAPLGSSPRTHPKRTSPQKPSEG